MDNRSFSLNYEGMTAIYDQAQDFETKLFYEGAKPRANIELITAKGRNKR